MASTRICVNNREINGYDDSDFMATFLIEGTDQFEEIMTGSTRFGGGSYFTKINASEEVKEMYQTWLGVQSAIRESRIVRVGKNCTIANSRKNKDKIGKVIEIRTSPYDFRITNAIVAFPDYFSQEVNITRILLTDML